jgi:basic membrane protein A and related proteins
VRIAKAIAAILVAFPVMLAGPLPAGAAQSAPAAKSFHACMVTDTGGINDHSFNELTWRGLLAAKAADHKIKTTFLQSTSTADYAPNIDTFLSEGCGIIVTVGFLMADATQTAGKANPHQHFAIVDCTYRAQCLSGRRLKNIDQLGFNTVQDAFLGGYLAAGESKTGTVATYGGEHFGTVTIYSPERSSATAPTSSSRSPAAPVLAPRWLSAAPTRQARRPPWSGRTLMAASAPRLSASTSSHR